MEHNPKSHIASSRTQSLSDDLGLWEPKRSVTLESARRHARNIMWMRRVLMTICAGLFAYVIWSFSQQKAQSLDIAVSATESARMVNPRYNGRTADGLPYKLTADTAIRPSYDSNEVTLANPIMEFFRQEGAASSFVAAESGVYDDVAQVLELKNNVVLKTDDGNSCETNEANISTQDKTITGSQPIECQGGFGEIRGQRFSITDNYSTFTFSGGMTGELRRDQGLRPALAPQ